MNDAEHKVSEYKTEFANKIVQQQNAAQYYSNTSRSVNFLSDSRTTWQIG